MHTYFWTSPIANQSSASTRTFQASAPGMYSVECTQSVACANFPLHYLYNVQLKPDAIFTTTYKPCHLNVELHGATIPNPILNNNAYQWVAENKVYRQPNAAHMFGSPGIKTIRYIVTAINGCKDTSYEQIKLSAPVDVAILNTSGSMYIPERAVVSLEAKSSYPHGTLAYNWTGANINSSQKYLDVYEAGVYSVVAIDKATLCADTATIKLEKASGLEVPNVFTPNKDGNNDVFILKAVNLSFNKAVIFDRWGNKVYENSEILNDIIWDGRNLQGKDCSDGVFFYLVSAQGKDGENYKQQGTITLLR
jgi:gliding motility-associated-like protein